MQGSVVTSNSRIEWMDIFKGIMIILVVVGHATGKFNGWIYQFHMAAFFFASGYLSNIEKRCDLSAVVKKVLTILLPFFTLGILGAVANGILNKIGLYETLFGSSFIGVGRTILELIIKGSCCVQYWGTFWFLVTLFGIEFLQVIIYQLNGKRLNWLYFIVSVVLYFCGYWFVRNSVVSKLWIFDLDLVFIAQFYFNIGLLFRKVNIGKYLYIEKKSGISIVAVIAVIISFWGRMNGITVDYPSRGFRYLFAECVVALSSIFIVYFISKLVEDYIKPLKKVLIVFGKNSLGIMVLHFIFFKIFMYALYRIGRAEATQITNVVMPTELSDIYWIQMAIIALICSLGVWTLLGKIPVVRFLLGQDIKWNNIIMMKVSESKLVLVFGSKCSEVIQNFWNRLEGFVKERKVFSISIAVIVVLFSIPMYRTGIIINDELQARCLAMQGFITFYKNEFGAWIGQGRLLAAPINSFTKYLSFIGADTGTHFRIGSILILLGVVIAFGIFIFKTLNNKYFAIFTAVFALSCMPIAFEHTSPNAFVGFIAFSFMLVLISNTLYISYIESRKKSYAIASMVMYFIAMMSYEAFITFTVLYLFVVLGKTGIRNIMKNIKLYLMPIITAILFLICYVISSKLCPSGYEGNQLGFGSLGGLLKIISNLFVASIPGFYIIFPRYQYFKTLYYNLELGDYIRIGIFAIVFVIICNLVLGKLVNCEQEHSKDLVVHKGKWCNLFIVFCGLSYMILPSLPNSMASMYQGIVGFNGSFLTLPVTFFEYFAAVFVVCYLFWQIIKKVGKNFYVVVIVLMCLITVNVQQMNDIFSKEQSKNFKRLTAIEAFLKTNTVRNLPSGAYFSSDLYKQQNLLAIHNGYWSTYCNNVLGLGLQITAERDGTEIGNIFYDGDNFVIVNSQNIIVVSEDSESTPKAVQIADEDYAVFNFLDFRVSASTEGKYFIYSIVNDGSVFSNVGYAPLTGYYADGWIEASSTYNVKTGEEGKVKVKLYYPADDLEEKVIEVFWDEQLVKTIELNDHLLEFEIDIEPNATANLRLECNFVFDQKDSSDIRPIAIILSEMTVL